MPTLTLPSPDQQSAGFRTSVQHIPCKRTYVVIFPGPEEEALKGPLCEIQLNSLRTPTPALVSIPTAAGRLRSLPPARVPKPGVAPQMPPSPSSPPNLATCTSLVPSSTQCRYAIGSSCLTWIHLSAYLEYSSSSLLPAYSLEVSLLWLSFCPPFSVSTALFSLSTTSLLLAAPPS